LPELVKLIEKGEKQKQLFQNNDYSKSLIIISGNLDEAYQMSGDLAQSEIDADIYHNFTKKIDVVNIKQALSNRFRPEQISRLGNIHLIYRSFSKQNFEEIISRDIHNYIQDCQKHLGISLQIDDSVHKLIYQNSVYPVQGIRPVLSSTIEILQSNILPSLLQAVSREQKQLSVEYDFESSSFIFSSDQGKSIVSFQGSIDLSKQSISSQEVYSTSIHESGHAIMYAKMFGIVPLQLKSKLPNTNTRGFTFPHRIALTKENIIKQVQILLAGNLAEKLILGEEKMSAGHEHDFSEATKLVSKYLRSYGFGDFIASSAMPNGDDFHFNTDLKKTDSQIEKIISTLYQDTHTILVGYKLLLEELSSELMHLGELSPQQIQEFMNKHGLECLCQKENYLIY
jgi:hypothetical protein